MLNLRWQKQTLFLFLTSFFFFFSCLSLYSQPFPVCGEDSKFVIVNTRGEIVARTEFSIVNTFSNGFAVASNGDIYSFIDETGKKVFNKDFEDARSFSEGLAAVRLNEKWGYINTSGEMVIQPQFGEAYDFSEGLACVLQGKPEEETALYGYISPDGKFQIKPFLGRYDIQSFDEPGKFVGGLAPAWLRSGSDNEMSVGFINTRGEIAIKPDFGGAGHFGNGLAPISIDIEDSPGSWGFIDIHGKMVIKPLFDMAHSFSEGLAPAYAPPKEDESEVGENSNNAGFINTSGEWVIPAMYQMVEPFINGYAKVYIDENNEGFIRKDGSLVTSTRMLQAKISSKPSGDSKSFKPVKISASSFLQVSKSKNISYFPENSCDNDTATAWIENQKGNGIGEWLKFEFEKKIGIEKIIIWPGYQKTASEKRDPFKSNLRPAKIKISHSNGSFEEELSDQRGSQAIEMPQGKTTFIKIEILSVHGNGAEAPDCGFSEIEFIGKL